MAISNIEGILNLYKQLKADRKILNWHEFANRIGYKRTYISRVINEHEPLSPELLSKINETDFGDTKNDRDGTNDYSADYIQSLKDQIALLKENNLTAKELKEIKHQLAEQEKYLNDLKVHALSSLARLITLFQQAAKVRANIEKGAVLKKIQEEMNVELADNLREILQKHN